MPTFSIASAIRWPISASPLEMVATDSISSLVSTGLDSSSNLEATSLPAFSIPCLTKTGFAPFSTASMPRWIIDWASKVAVVVPSPAASLVLLATS